MAQENKKSEKKKVKRSRSAQKRDRQAEKSRLRNRSFKACVRTARRSLEEAVAKAVDASNDLNLIYSLMDKGVKLGVFKKNKASRVKSRAALRSTKKSA